MVETRQDWWGELDYMQQQMERFLDHFASCKRRPVMFSEGAWQPLVDVYETENEVVVLAELAGVKREDVRIVLENEKLLLTGARRDSRAGTRRLYSLMEVSFGRFERVIDLPAAVQPESASANLESGFLVIVMTKVQEPTTKRVSVTTGGEAGERQEQR